MTGKPGMLKWGRKESDMTEQLNNNKKAHSGTVSKTEGNICHSLHHGYSGAKVCFLLLPRTSYLACERNLPPAACKRTCDSPKRPQKFSN